MIDEEGSYSTEFAHSHYCEECGGVWSHNDESCVGPRWNGRMYMNVQWTCPMCEEQQ